MDKHLILEKYRNSEEKLLISKLFDKIEMVNKSNKIEITNYFKKVIIYDKNYTPIEIGDKVIVTGINRKISANHNQYAFDYQKYCFSKRIVSIINAEVIETKKSVNVYIVKKYIYKYLDHFFNQSIKFERERYLIKSSFERSKTDCSLVPVRRIIAKIS